MTDLKSLIAELERAKEGSRTLSDKVLLACGWSYEPNRYGPGGPQWGGGGLWTDPLGIGTAASDPRPSPTESLDAALTLVPEGWCGGGRLVGLPPYGMELLATDGLKVRLPGPKLVSSSGATPALALCSVALKAREAA